MPNERYAELAVVALRDAIASGLNARLAAIEVEQGIATPIRRPVAIVRARGPASDNRSPLIAVYWESMSPVSQRQGFVSVDCTVVVAMVADTAATLEPLEETHARYVTALLDLVRLDPHLGGRVVAAIFTDAEADAGVGDRSMSRMTTAIGIEVRIHSP